MTADMKKTGLNNGLDDHLDFIFSGIKGISPTVEIPSFDSEKNMDENEKFISRIECSFDKVDENNKKSTFEESVSDSLAEKLPRIKQGFFSGSRTICIPLEAKNRQELVQTYCNNVRGISGSVLDNFIKSNNRLELKCLVSVPEYEEMDLSDTIEKSFLKKGSIVCKDMIPLDNISEIKIVKGYNDYIGVYGSSSRGTVNLETSINWEAPFKADIFLPLPKMSQQILVLKNEALHAYYGQALENQSKDRGLQSCLKTPCVKLYWRPQESDFSYSIQDMKFERTKAQNPDPELAKCVAAVVLEIDDNNKRYHHLIAMVGIDDNEKPIKKTYFKNL